MKTKEHVHFVGIGGYGMSAIARVLLDMGYPVSGSDVTKKELTDKLEARGATVYIGHDSSHVAGADFVVYSTDIPKDNVELREAIKQNIPLVHRSDMLARLLNEKKGIAVSGAHGKTTTSSMIALILEKAGVDPTYVIGGEIVDLNSNAKAGKSDYVVAEADESDASFLKYYPYIAVVTNIEADHLENYNGDFKHLIEAYYQFLGQIREDGIAILCEEDSNLQEIKMKLNTKIVTYGLSQGDYTVSNLQLGDGRSSFTVLYQGQDLGEVKLAIPGTHNVLNALAAIIASLQVGVPFEKISEILGCFRGAKRRFQHIGLVHDILVIDDYAHHPTEIKATINGAKSTGRRIIAVFQPQRYTRTYFLLDDFSKSFGEADEVVIADIYSPAGEKQIEGVSAKRLVELIREKSHSGALFIPTKEEILQFLKEKVQPGDIVITMGAGDIWKVAHSLVDSLKIMEK
ncbi:UDP-N-acetylmuramate--L-alanine ligase [Microaerobacter geothermalis]|uniref:UDP-N-acetylmuramate--L-alanine ligase n=1 Tax=Microaerobacter geothermalis TaxID=674972 RepID=UPI001F294CC6|nr:UDP-N-acetylmuramate--L-alanine ligase [Microaerobacter geothermalis]MCF6092691.1 UDP-N-acetylmuramate--L-alanine ligase [Microaerobacter geothermalis]